MKLRERLLGMFKNDFVKNVLILVSGSTIAQFLPVILSPLLGRLYTPSDFGVYTLFTSTVNILGQLVGLKYDFAIVVSDLDEKANGLFFLSMSLTVGISAAMILAFPFATPIDRLLGGDGHIGWIFCLPLAALMTGMYSSLNYYNVRLKQYKAITNANIIKTVVQSILQLGFALLHWGAMGLILGQMISFVAGNTRMIHNLRGKVHRKDLNRHLMGKVGREYSNYPKFTLPGSLANTMTYNVISYFLSALYSTSQLGYYSMINRVLGSPLSLVGNAVGQVFVKQAADEKNSSGNLAHTFNNISKLLMVLSVPLFAILFIFAEPIITIFLGPQWAPAAEYVRILTPMFLVRFIVSPISNSALVMGKQKMTMIWQFGLLLFALVPTGVAALWDLTVKNYLLILSISLAIAYFVFYVYCHEVVKEYQNQ
ncbi:lipopolysaccharide biosynthesis protein [Zongyangia hominis]|uniref:Oligosaccharide flippase family protein n=1 Tax=Zongyangia hominis TaxID=2763677 RepID=A0A926EAK5_9FIRM|nr:oligosaccharide flippase family protein [Zongyangia hominis]MBC8569470.1 oligosaccharide flippase family protein [Zongyangia hominis]